MPAQVCDGVLASHAMRRHAFTLVELLVVIAIVSVLAALFFPVLGRVRGSAQRMTCAHNLRQMGVGGHLLVNDNRGYLPDRRGWGPTPALGRTGRTHPALPVYLGMTANPPIGVQPPSVMSCPALYSRYPPSTPWSLTYGIAVYTTASHIAREQRIGSLPWPGRLANLSEEQAFFIEGAISADRLLFPGEPTFYNTHSEPSRIDGVTGSIQQYPHEDSMNVVFVGGHVLAIDREWAIQNLQTPAHRFWRSDL